MFKSPEKLLARAGELERKGKSSQALEIYRELSESDAQNCDLLVLRAEKELSLGQDSREAAEWFFRAGERLLRMGKLKQAFVVCQQALAADRTHGPARRVSAILEKRLERIGEKPAAPAASDSAVPEVIQDEREEPIILGIGSRSARGSIDEPAASPAASEFPPDPTPIGAFLLPVEPTRSVPIGEPTPPIPSIPTIPPLDALVLSKRLKTEPIQEAVQVLIDERPVDVFEERRDARKLSPLSSPFLAELDNALLQSLVDMASMEHVPSGRVIFRQGEHGDRLYVILDGEVDVVRQEIGGTRVVLAHLRAGTFFGEMALLTSEPRNATVQAAQDCQLLVISREQVQHLIATNTDFLQMLLRFFRARLIGTLVQTTPLFKGLTLLERRDLVAKFRLLEVPPGGVVIREEEPSSGLSIVLAGRLAVVRKVEGAERRLATLSHGDIYGEISLLTNGPAVATVRAETKVWALSLGRQDFEATIGRKPSSRQMLERLANQRMEANQAILKGEIPYSEGRIEPV